MASIIDNSWNEMERKLCNMSLPIDQKKITFEKTVLIDQGQHLYNRSLPIGSKKSPSRKSICENSNNKNCHHSSSKFLQNYSTYVPTGHERSLYEKFLGEKIGTAVGGGRSFQDLIDCDNNVQTNLPAYIRRRSDSQTTDNERLLNGHIQSNHNVETSRSNVVTINAKSRHLAECSSNGSHHDVYSCEFDKSQCNKSYHAKSLPVKQTKHRLKQKHRLSPEACSCNGGRPEFRQHDSVYDNIKNVAYEGEQMQDGGRETIRNSRLSNVSVKDKSWSGFRSEHLPVNLDTSRRTQLSKSVNLGTSRYRKSKPLSHSFAEDVSCNDKIQTNLAGFARLQPTEFDKNELSHEKVYSRNISHNGYIETYKEPSNLRSFSDKQNNKDTKFSLLVETSRSDSHVRHTNNFANDSHFDDRPLLLTDLLSSHHHAKVASSSGKERFHSNVSNILDWLDDSPDTSFHVMFKQHEALTRADHLENRAKAFHRHLVLRKTVDRWKSFLVFCHQRAAAVRLHREHMLRKGMRALAWARQQTQTRHDILTCKSNLLHLQAIFNKWALLTRARQHQRLQAAFQHWELITQEAQRNRIMIKMASRFQQKKHFIQWRVELKWRRKLKKAVQHHRKVELTKLVNIWKIFSSWSLEKKCRSDVARLTYDGNLQQKTFLTMNIICEQYKKAKAFWRIHLLKHCLLALSSGSRISRSEHQHAMASSVEHWRRRALQRAFLSWREELATRKAVNLDRRKKLSCYYEVWYLRWQRNVLRRDQIEAEMCKTLKCWAVCRWRAAVTDSKRQQQMAAVCIERAVVLGCLHNWHRYTYHKKMLQNKMKQHLMKSELTLISECFIIWLLRHQNHLEERRAFELWSVACVRKAADKWKQVYRQNTLNWILLNSEPDRKCRFLEAAFKKWVAAKLNVDRDNEEVQTMIKLIHQSKLRRLFLKWRMNTQQMLTIRPLVDRGYRRLLTRVFGAWRSLVQHKTKCERNLVVFHRIQLRKHFYTWRRQFLLHMLVSDSQDSLARGQLVRVIHGWREIIKRKKRAVCFRHEQMIKHAFFYWKSLTRRLILGKTAALVRQNHLACLVRSTFCHWKQLSWQQQAEEDNSILSVEQHTSNNMIRMSFSTWKRQLHVLRIARAHRSDCRTRLLHQILVAWHQISQQSMTEAVHQFSCQIGLHADDGRHADDGGFWDYSDWSSSGFDSNKESSMGYKHDMISGHFDALLDVDSRDGDQVSISSAGLDSNWSLSSVGGHRRSMDDSCIVSMATALSDVNEDVMSQQEVERKGRLKDTVRHVLTRMRNYPTCVLFYQWLEWTQYQQGLKEKTFRLKCLCETNHQRLVFSAWRLGTQHSLAARQHLEVTLLSKMFKNLKLNRVYRRHKRQLSESADQHRALTVYKKEFPRWLAKTLVQQHQKQVLMIWNSVTPGEDILQPRGDNFQQKVHRRRLREFFDQWIFDARQRMVAKNLHQQNLLLRFFQHWTKTSQTRQHQKYVCKNFSDKRMRLLTFQHWRLRLHQKTSVDQRNVTIWRGYLREILETWHLWASASCKHRGSQQLIVAERNHRTLVEVFSFWRSEAEKCRNVSDNYKNRLKMRIVRAWYNVVQWKRDAHEKMVSFQIRCRRNVIKLAYANWHSHYLHVLDMHAEHTQLMHLHALKIGRHWRHAAQKARSRRHCQALTERKLCKAFGEWRLAYQRTMVREEELKVRALRVRKARLRSAFHDWHAALLLRLAQKHFDRRLLTSAMHGWAVWAQTSVDRCMRVQALQSAHRARTQQTTFQFWLAVTRLQQSVQVNYELKLQTRVLKNWSVFVKRKQNLLHFQSIMRERSNALRVLHFFRLWQSRDLMRRHRESLMEDFYIRSMNAALRSSFSIWQQRLLDLKVTRARCILLASRAARQWKRFVQRKMDERQIQWDKLQYAEDYYNRRKRMLVFSAWFSEVQVRRHIRTREQRLLEKYGHLWKRCVDMSVVARLQERVRLLLQSWRQWRVILSKKRAITRVEGYVEQQMIKQTFTAWQSICKRKRSHKCHLVE